MAKKQQRVNLEDVAREAGVSMMTVSRVINNKGRVSEATRQQVLAVVEKLGYRPNWAARALATHRTDLVAFVVPDITNPYFSEIFQGIEDVLREENYNVLVANTNESAYREKHVLEKLDDTAVDGLIVCSSRLPQDELTPLVKRFESVVMISRSVPKSVASSVLSHYRLGERAVLAIEYLYEIGYRNIGYLALTHSKLSYSLDDFRVILEEKGVPLPQEYCRLCDPTWKAGHKAGTKLLTEHPELDALVGGNDLVALGAMRAAIDLGMCIPDDLAIIGADDILLSSQVSPPITTYRIDKYSIGKTAAEFLLLRMGGDRTYREYFYKSELIVRESTPPKVLEGD